MLAERRAIPDLQVRFGYVKDWFVTSGNQPNSLFVGVTVPLPVFDHGQHDAQAAAVLAAATDRARAVLQEGSRRSLASIADELKAFEERRARLREQTIPLARRIVERLGEAVGRGAADLQDLILARRTLEELSIDALDVELSAFKLSITRARLSGVVPPLPPELQYRLRPHDGAVAGALPRLRQGLREGGARAARRDAGRGRPAARVTRTVGLVSPGGRR